MAATDKALQLQANGTVKRVPDGNVVEVGSGIQSSLGNLTITGQSGFAVVFNDAAANIDVRMEGQSNANLFFLDASTDHIGLGTATPSTLLDLNGAFTIRGMSAPAVSPAGQGRVYFDSTLNRFRVSENGGSFSSLITGTGSSGQVTTWGASGLEGDNNLFWDTTNDRLGIRTVVPATALEVASGQAAFAAGSTGAPGITLVGDLDTGITSTTANELRIVSGSNTRVTAASTGVTLTGAIEEVSNGSGNTLFLRLLNTGGSLDAKRWAMYFDTAVNGNALRFVTENDALSSFSEILTLARSGNVGIATTAPGAKLDVRGSVTINEDGIDADVRIEGTSDVNLFVTDASTNRVGIGLALPLAKLHASTSAVESAGRFTNSSASVTDVVFAENTSTTAVPTIAVGNNTGAASALMSVGGSASAATFLGAAVANVATMQASGASVTALKIGSTAAIPLVFGTSDTERVRILSGGNVGIGTATPAGKLEVRDDTSTVNLILTKQGVTGQNDLLEFRTDAFTTAERHVLRWTTASGSTVIGRYGMEFDGSFNTVDFVWRDQFNVSATSVETMRLKGNGRLGLGTSAPSSVFDLNGDFNIRGMSAPSVSPAGQGRIYFDSGTNKWKISENGGAYTDLLGAGSVSGTGVAGQVAFWTATSTIAGDTDYVWDSTNNRLGLNVGASPNSTLDVGGAFNIRASSAPAVAPGSQGRIYFDSGTNKWRISENGSAYQDLLGAAGISGSGVSGRLTFWNGISSVTSDASLFWDDTNNFLGVNQATPTSTLHTTGSVSTAITTISSNTTLTSAHHTILGSASGGNITLTLPLASTCSGRAYWVKKIDSSSNTVTVARSGSDTIDGATSDVLGSQWESYVYKSDGASWYRF